MLRSPASQILPLVLCWNLLSSLSRHAFLHLSYLHAVLLLYIAAPYQLTLALTSSTPQHCWASLHDTTRHDTTLTRALYCLAVR